MIVLWTPEAEKDRIDIWDYIVADNPVAAVELDSHFSDAASSLATQPEMGVPGLIVGTRELYPHHHYRLVYEIDSAEGIVWILALVSTFREWPLF
ncbi:type II toxin-antitoxin system RelE/ParE family toxin [Citrobacter amalonaticus]|uniref:type II toxin-antitoxin system RelE/ParE family toxin n=1 Tax=Citrobacter amalonaticus TaxID=35703 RepID=UPI001A1E2C26|nr:type II toxin-antitoxin system RelE/ParE family toxin [Citrobacter amalonaticus]HDQ2811416.1 type II toxin-antitoxin system RelE/ParE family toxin [Citrobacter amalonaticus]